MSVLYWEPPEKIMSKEDWKRIEADCAPPGTYTPNMSKEDVMKWKAKYRAQLGQVEIRRDGLVVVVSLKGYSYKGHGTGIHHSTSKHWAPKKARIHIATSKAQMLSLEEWYEMMSAVEEAKMVLEMAKTYPKEVKAAIKENRVGDLLQK